ncbi:hypothetical protein GCM10012275_14330 [Longimycelium tulufanense]|uniref:Aminoglycoside phosphotransferase domain-containing protein n=1 Tax=Longimycelium tulufanense TaxID=907463 RepID=A0A8J3FTV3_9PSEU|nr:phosphotransferase [Longimycelium tulufanense]GGM44467.1 hypothetical protein GCM10012275_14330 [Longimycelium tulufanense]
MRPEITAALAVAADHGLAVTEPVVLAERSNLVIHLRPYPVVARVATRTAAARPNGAEDWLRREVALLAHLRGRHAVPPVDLLPPGPHTRHGFRMVFAGFVDHRVSEPDPRALGRSLRELHVALADYRGDLPELGLITEAGTWLGQVDPHRHELSALREEHAEIVERLRKIAPPFQALHGDAHAGNVLPTADGPRWTDFEDSFRGPVEWDVACLITKTLVTGWGERGLNDVGAVLRGYGLDGRGPLLDLMVRARALVGVAWLLRRAITDPDAHRRARPWIDWIVR